MWKLAKKKLMIKQHKEPYPVATISINQTSLFYANTKGANR